MANSNTVVIRTAKEKTPSTHNLKHNSGLTSANYWVDRNPDIRQSFKPEGKEQAEQIWQSWEAEARERYFKKSGRQVRNDAILIEEGLISIGKDVVDRFNLDKLEAVAKEFTAKFAKDNNTRVLHYALHDHEGKDTKEKNLHVHFLFSNVSNTGEMVRRNWKKTYMSQLQTDLYNISKKHYTNIQRAINYAQLGLQAPKHTHHRQFRKDKEKEELQQERIKTVETKKQLERSTAETAQLKQEFEEFRKQLIEQGGHSKEDYNALGSLKKEVVADKKIGTAEALKMLEQLKAKIKEIQEPKLTDKLIASATTKTLTGQKVNTNLLKENFNTVIQGVQEIAYAQENVLNRMMRGLNTMFAKAKRVIKKQKQTIDYLRSKVKQQENKIKGLETELKKTYKDMTLEELVSYKVEEERKLFLAYDNRSTEDIKERVWNVRDEYKQLDKEIEKKKKEKEQDNVRRR